jgi:hypothetical protein
VAVRRFWSQISLLRRGAREEEHAVAPGPPRLPHLPERPQRPVIWTSLALLALLAAFVVLLWRVGLFDFQQKVSDAKVFAAVLGLVGGLFATSMTFAAALLKHSIDVRNLGQARETEARLRLETSIRAVELLTDEGQKATRTRQAGALFVLSSLDQLDFSLALLDEIWPAGDITTTAAVWVVNRALRGEDERIQLDAATLLARNAARLTFGTRCYEWPPCVSHKWPNSIPVLARQSLLEALIKMTASRPACKWEYACVNTLIVQFNCIFKFDQARYIRDGAALCLELLLDSRFYRGRDYRMKLPSGPLSVADLRDEVKAALVAGDVEVTDQTRNAVERLRPTWMGKEEADDVEAKLATGPSTGVAAAEPKT